jgi:cytoskeletal protein CcmA (bactofilin family)
MKKWQWLIGLLLVICLVALPTQALAQSESGDKFVFGGTFTLGAGEQVNGNLYILGGSVRLEADSRVTGDVYLAGGSLQADGEINGDVTVAGGSIRMGDEAVVGGDVNLFGGNLQQAEGARVEGDVNQENGTPPVIPGVPSGAGATAVAHGSNPILSALWFLFRIFMWAALAVLTVLFLPRQTERVAGVITSQPLIAGGIGLLTGIVAPIAVVIMAITLILLPLSFGAALVLAALWAFGLIAAGTEVGRRLGEGLHQVWALPLAAGVGTFLLMLIVNSLHALIPCIGWMVPVIVGSVGLGAVLLTRGGTQPYPLFDPLEERATQLPPPGGGPQVPLA